MEKEPRKVLENIYAEKEYMDKRVSEGIEKNRKGDIKIRITGNGKPLSGTKIKVTQTTHDFHYGANIFMLDQFENEEKNKLYRKYFGESFNIATLPFYWNDLEPAGSQCQHISHPQPGMQTHPHDKPVGFGQCRKHQIHFPVKKVFRSH